MDIALHLARKGAGKVNPNPLVGAVIVNDGKIIGKGYHQSFLRFSEERRQICLKSQKN